MKSFIALVLLFSLNVNAAQCVYVDGAGTVKSSATPIELCNDLVLVSKVEYESMNVNTVVATLIDLFEFSVEDFAYFNAVCLIGFITGHSIGRVTRLLGKT
ncbi:MAG: hypothetical protein MJK12_03865 [Colwellia sp.]|nr:hypothetical protein [Colwellia sp.]